MIISFSGPSCSGKTTLVKALKKRLEGEIKVAVIDETARTVFMEKFREFEKLENLRRNNEAFLEYEIEIVRRQIREEKEAKEKADIVLADRSIYDTYAYSKIYLPKDLFLVFLDFFEKHAKRKYDFLFLCHHLTPVKDDFRSVDDLFSQKEQYDLIKEAIRIYHKGVFHEIPEMSLEERLKIVQNKLPLFPTGGDKKWKKI